MLNYIWVGLIIISVIFAFTNGQSLVLSTALLDGAGEAVNIVLSTLGVICFWSGIMRVAEESKITLYLSKLMSPLVKKLFPGLNGESKAMSAICLNITANFLGLGNAATPFGLKAIKELSYINPLDKHTASDNMVMFVVINTASLQLIPTMMIALRIKHNSVSPFEILPAVWASSLCALLVGIAVAKAFERK